MLGVYAGVRPLLRPVATGADPDTDTTSALSRDHSVVPGPDGLITIVGGKYTTYRLMAQDTIDAAVASGRLGDVPAIGKARKPETVANVLAAVAAGWALGLTQDVIVTGIKTYGLELADPFALLPRRARKSAGVASRI